MLHPTRFMNILTDQDAMNEGRAAICFASCILYQMRA
jgi:putative intracellular protease/amidase